MLEKALTTLRSAPGPAPWYATASPLRDGELLRWCALRRGDDEFGGANLLLDEGGSVLFVLPRYSCAQLIRPSLLLCWQELEEEIALRVFDTNAFQNPFAKSIDAARKEAAGMGRKLIWTSGLIWEGRILQSDCGAYHFPDPLKDVEELLFWVHKGTTRLYQLLPRRQEIIAHPQDWFNNGDYDLGYQWPMLVAREEKSQTVVGYGLRLGVFVLDSTLSNIEVWLRKDPFAYYLNPNP